MEGLEGEEEIESGKLRTVRRPIFILCQAVITRQCIAQPCRKQKN